MSKTKPKSTTSKRRFELTHPGQGQSVHQALGQVFQSMLGHQPEVLLENQTNSTTSGPGNTEVRPAANLYSTSVRTDLEPLSVQTENLYGQKPSLSVQKKRSSKAISIPVRTDTEPLSVQRSPSPKTPKISYRRSEEVRFELWIDRDLMQKIKGFCQTHGLSVKEYFVNLSTKHLEPLSVQRSNLCTDHDDNMILHDDKLSSVHAHISAFERLTGRKATPKDNRIALKYVQVDPKLIEIAMVLCIERKLRGNTSKDPIKSFSYFEQEIIILQEQTQAGTLPANLDEYYKYVVSTWDKRIKQQRDEKWANSFR